MPKVRGTPSIYLQFIDNSCKFDKNAIQAHGVDSSLRRNDAEKLIKIEKLKQFVSIRYFQFCRHSSSHVHLCD